MKLKRFILNIIISLAFIFISIIIFNSCRHEPDNLDLLPAVCFESKILPIFQTSCNIAGCHNGAGESGYDFRSYEGILSSVVPGNPAKSTAYRAITTYLGESAMPPSQPLSEENRTLIRIWIAQGAQNTSCPDSIGISSGYNDPTYNSARICFQNDILPVIQANCGIPGCHDGTSKHE